MSDKHYEIYKINTHKRYELAKLIFSIIKSKHLGEIPNVSKNRLKELIPIIYNDPRIKNLDNSSFSSWAIP